MRRVRPLPSTPSLGPGAVRDKDEGVSQWECVVLCPHPSTALLGEGGLEGGRILLVGDMGVYDYAPYIRSVGEGRVIRFDCTKGRVLQGLPGGEEWGRSGWRRSG